jgi:murein DD-endopeptidase MepM/ murein hydrolase activator NlpD
VITQASRSDITNADLRAVYYNDLEIEPKLLLPSWADERQRSSILKWISPETSGQLYSIGGRTLGNGISETESRMNAISDSFPFAITWLKAQGIIWPTQGEITTTYNDPEYPFFTPDGSTMPHPRLDIANSKWTPIYAPFDGEITAIYEDTDAKGFGIEIQGSDGLSTRLIHLLRRPYWEVGDKVEMGQQVGFIGNSGKSTGPHLDFMLYIGPLNQAVNNAIDPRNILGWVERGESVSW